MNRKLLPKSMKPYAMFIAGLVSGVAVTLWWGGRRSRALTGQAGEVNDIEYHLTTGDVEVDLLTNGLIELWQPNELIILSATQLDDICRWWTELRQSKLDSLAKTQPIRAQQDKTLYNCYCSYCKCHCQSYSLYCIHCGKEMTIIGKVVKESKDE